MLGLILLFTLKQATAQSCQARLEIRSAPTGIVGAGSISSGYDARLHFAGTRFALDQAGINPARRTFDEVEVWVRGRLRSGDRRLELPLVTRRGLACVLNGTVDLATTDCGDVTARMMGVTLRADELVMEHVRGSEPVDEARLVPGDAVALRDARGNVVHFAVYLGAGPRVGHVYVSQLGTGRPLAVTGLRALLDIYGAREARRVIFKNRSAPAFAMPAE